MIEDIVEYKRNWRKNNKEKWASYQKKYKKSEKGKQAKRRYNEKYKDLILKRNKKRPSYGRHYGKITYDRIKARIPKNLYKKYKRDAEYRKMLFQLSLEEFEKLVNEKCFYCGEQELNGLDRRNSKIGYTLENSVSCCSICNRMKWAYSEEIFINQCKKIVALFGGEKNKR